MFRDRREAGRLLAPLVREQVSADALVLALPRGGVPVGYEVAHALGAQLDVFVVRKLGVPGHRELAFGALASGGARVLNEDVVTELGLSERAIAAVVAEESAELERRERLYRSAPAPDVQARQVVLVDDGVATGASLRVALRALRERAPARLVVAVPVSSREGAARIEALADGFVAYAIPERLTSVGSAYDSFDEVADDEVRRLLEAANGAGPAIAGSTDYNPFP
jgi:putative phosphoribosyl transferase